MTFLLLAASLAVVPLGSRPTQRLLSTYGSTIEIPPLQAPEAVRRSLPSLVLGAGAVAVTLLFRMGGPALAAALGLALLCVSRLTAARRRRRAQTVREARQVAALRRLVAELDVGRPLDQARELVDANGEGGVPIEHAERVSGASGAPSAVVLAAVAADVASEQQRRTELRIALAGTRSSGLLMALLPLVGLALGEALGAHPLRVLTHTEVGHGLCLLAVFLQCMGLLWTNAIADRAARL